MTRDTPDKTGVSLQPETLIVEIWKTIPEAPVYQASSLGRVRNSGTGHVLSARKRKDGYHQVGLREGQPKRLFRKVSTLVCQAFHGPRPFPKAVAAHEDGTRDNNTPGNLYWATHKQNHADREAHGRAPKGVRNGAAYLDEAQVLRIRELLKRGITQAEIAGRFNVCNATVSNINTKRNWSHL